jgi:sec-independent protein translocase protein TatB
MFNIGPMELLVLGIVAVIVIGPDRLPALARDAARMLKTLRELATGARTQLRDELGPEFADLGISDLRNLNPRTALQRAILGDEETGLRADLRKLDPREAFRDVDPRDSMRDAMRDDEPISMRKPVERPLARGEQAPYDEDAT